MKKDSILTIVLMSILIIPAIGMLSSCGSLRRPLAEGAIEDGLRRPVKVISVAPSNRLGYEDHRLETIYLYDIKYRKEDSYYLNAFYEAEDCQVQKQIRNEIIFEWIAILDEHFYNQQLSQRSTKLMGKGLGIGLSLGSTVTGGDTAKVLSGLSALVQAGNNFVDREVLKSNTLSAIGMELERNRKTIYEDIVKKTKDEVATYTIAEAQRDILRYWKSGSPTFALHGLVEKAAAEAEDSAEALKKAEKKKEASDEKRAEGGA